MKLHVWGSAPNPRRVRMYLAEKGLSVPIEDVGDNFGLRSKYRSQYPFAMVPMLQLEDGTQIGEAMAICRYFETLHPDPPLMGVSAKEKALVEMWERRANDEGMIGAAECLRNAHPNFKDRGLAGYLDPVPQVAALVLRGQQRLTRFFAMFDGRLAESEFVAGDQLSVADITAVCAVDFASAFAQISVPDNFRNLRRWYAMMSARPSARA